MSITTDGEPIVWYTVDEAAVLCHRSPKTIRNLVALHQIPRRLLWSIIRRKRRRIMFLSPAAVKRLQELTLEAP